MYASKSTVPVGKSKAEIEKMVRGAGANRFATAVEDGQATVLFELYDRRVRFRIPMPSDEDVLKSRTKAMSVIRARKEQLERSRWRQLFLVIKAKIESWNQGIETFEEAFLAQIVLPSGDTFGDWAIPQIEDAYKGKKLPPLLGSGR